MKFCANGGRIAAVLPMLLTTCRAEAFNHKAPRMDTNGPVPSIAI
jgi:hypothetical protein